MMPLISLAILVAFMASGATSLGAIPAEANGYSHPKRTVNLVGRDDMVSSGNW